MRALSEKYKELAQRAGRYPKLRMELYAGTRGAWTDTVEQEYSGENAIVSATYTNGIITKPSRFETGLAFCGSLEIELHGVATTPFIAWKRFKLFSGFYDPEEDETAEAAMGEFFIESISADNGKITLKARDKMMFAEQKFNALLLTYPCSLLDCVREIFRQMGFAMPEDYTLDINPTVVAPAWQKPNMTEGVYSNGKYYVKDPEGYSITMPGETAPTKGHAYSATGYALTCREALASVAKMQLGNCFIDGDGIPRFSSYKAASPLGDDRVTELSVGEESFIINSLLQNYMGYDVESVTLYKRRATERRGEIMYYTKFPSDLPESYDPVKSRAFGKSFREGTIERKGLGEVEIGEFINYTGKMGAQRFFVFGLQYEWSGASFDETLYSFAPDYKGVDYEWLNDRDLVADEDKEDEPKEEEKPETPEVSGGGVTINQAVIITEADAKYLLHDFTQIEYNRGSQIGYAGPGNQIVLQETICYKNKGIAPNGKIVNTASNKDPSELPDIPLYVSLNFNPEIEYSSKKFVEMKVNFVRATNSYTIFQIVGVEEDQKETAFTSANVYDSNGVRFALIWSEINAPSDTYPCGYAKVLMGYRNLGASNMYQMTVLTNLIFAVPFASLAEYQAAVGLTYEPLTLTRVEDNPTVVSGKDIGEEVT